MSASTDQRETLWHLIKDIRFAMFTTRHGNGHLHASPMTTQNCAIDEDERLWFFMSRSGRPAADLRSDDEVCLSYADPDKDRYVSVSGRARVVHNPAKLRMLWSKLNEAWFPGGMDDPDLALVEVQISHAHYWDVRENKLVQLYQMARAVITGRPPLELGESVEIRMR